MTRTSDKNTSPEPQPIPYSPPLIVRFFQVDTDWPKTDEMKIVWGNGPMRFGYRDEDGQWRSRNTHPMHAAPKCWADIPVILTPAQAAMQGDPDAVCFSLLAFLWRQREWSEATFGPGPRVTAVLDHIRNEIVEVEEAPGDLSEWLDVVTLALDGAWRAGFSPSRIIQGLLDLEARNHARQWPDWRTADPNAAIEHVRPAASSEALDQTQTRDRSSDGSEPRPSKPVRAGSSPAGPATSSSSR